jgi:hypothetical protein
VTRWCPCLTRLAGVAVVLSLMTMAGCGGTARTSSSPSTTTVKRSADPVMTVNPGEGPVGTAVHLVISGCTSVGSVASSIHTVFFHDANDLAHINAGSGLSAIDRTEVGASRDKVVATFTIPTTAPPGSGSFVALCGRSGAATSSFTVT